MAKARKKRSGRDAIAAAIATLREHAQQGVIILYELDTTTQMVVPTPHWISEPARDRPMVMEVARVLEKNPEAWG